MNKSIVVSAFLVLFFSTAIVRGQTSGHSVIETILSGYSAKMFTSEPVSDSEIGLILKFGFKVLCRIYTFQDHMP